MKLMKLNWMFFKMIRMTNTNTGTGTQKLGFKPQLVAKRSPPCFDVSKSSSRSWRKVRYRARSYEPISYDRNVRTMI